MLRRFTQVLASAFALLVSLHAFAFPIGPQKPPTVQVVEYFNTEIGHYFYTSNTDEIAAIDAGSAGPGWQKTGLVFSAYPSIAASGNAYFATCDRDAAPCVEVSRFYGTPGLGPNSHFYTANADEAAGLKKPGTGWTYEEVAFVLPVPDPATHQCAANTTPVFRFYNGRFAENDSNHRYTASRDAAALMRAAGWIDEGIAFCSYGQGWATIETHMVEVKSTSQFLRADVCDREANAGNSCLAFNNLPVPFASYTPASPSFSDQMRDAFSSKTLIATLGSGTYLDNIALPADSREAASQDVFVQLNGYAAEWGLNVSTLSKGPSPYSSIMPMKRLPTVAGATDERLFPFAVRYRTDYELRFGFGALVSPMALDAGSAGYGVGIIEYQDRRSSLRFRANLLAYGNAPGGDFIARDAKDGEVIVGTTPRQNSPYGRTFGSDVQVPGLPLPSTGNARGEWWWFVSRDQFQRTVDAARTLEPGLSQDPADYFVRSFGVSNEIYGSGRVSLTMYSIHLDLAPLYEP